MRFMRTNIYVLRHFFAAPIEGSDIPNRGLHIPCPNLDKIVFNTTLYTL